MLLSIKYFLLWVIQCDFVSKWLIQHFTNINVFQNLLFISEIFRWLGQSSWIWSPRGWKFASQYFCSTVWWYGKVLPQNLKNASIILLIVCKLILQILEQIEPYVYEWTSKHRGSISAEHGLGLMKANKIYYSKSPKTVSFTASVLLVYFLGPQWLLSWRTSKRENLIGQVQVMASIKKLLDPNGILNPYKVLPHSLNR